MFILTRAIEPYFIPDVIIIFQKGQDVINEPLSQKQNDGEAD